LGTSLGKGISAGADIKTLQDKVDRNQLSQTDFNAAKRNALFGTNATGDPRENAMAKIVNEFDSLDATELASLMAILTPQQRLMLEKLGKK